MKTYSAKPGEIAREWYVVDAEGQTLGRLATRIADALRGKGKAGDTAERRHGRLRRRREGGEDPSHGQQARPKALLPALRLPGRAAQPHAARPARPPAGGGAAPRRQGHAPEEPPRAPTDH